jgi:hypothetical protein
MFGGGAHVTVSLRLTALVLGSLPGFQGPSMSRSDVCR